jgi:hypothetical protein
LQGSGGSLICLNFANFLAPSTTAGMPGGSGWGLSANALLVNGQRGGEGGGDVDELGG